MNKFLCALIPLLFALVSARLDDNNVPPEMPADRYQLHEPCKDALLHQISLEMYASLFYQQTAAHFAHNKVARKGFAKFFMHNSDEEREHAQKMIDYVNSRGGVVTGFKIDMPHYTNWDSAQSALETALILENKVNNELHVLHGKAEAECKDPQLMDFIEGTFLNEQVESIDNIQRIITQLQGMDKAMGEFWINKELSE